MAASKKMFSDMNCSEVQDLMRTIETQSGRTLADWAYRYAQETYLPFFPDDFPGLRILQNALAAAGDYLNGRTALNALRAAVKEARLMAGTIKDPFFLASARAIATACAVILTPSNALGFLLYGSMAEAYQFPGPKAKPEELDAAARSALAKACRSLTASCIANEPNPAKIRWNCSE